MKKKLIVVRNAFDKGSFLLDRAEQLLQLVKTPLYQNVLAKYRHDLAMGKGKDSPYKCQLLAIIPQGMRRDLECDKHTADVLDENDLVFLDDDRSAQEISAEERYSLVLERLQERGLGDLPHVASRSASYQFHLIVPKIDRSLSIAENWKLWTEFFSGILVTDVSTKHVNRLQYFTGELLSGEDSLNLLFCDREDIPQVSPQLIEDCTQSEEKEEASTPNASVANTDLTAIAESIVMQLCGSLTPQVGCRNNTLYDCVRQLVYVDGTTLESITEAMENLGFLGLEKSEATACIKSAYTHPRTWLHTLPPELKTALAELNTDETTDESDDANADDIANVDIPEPELISLFTKHLPENTKQAAESVVFAALGSYLKNSVTIRDVANKPRNIQFTSVVVGSSSCGKGFVDVVLEPILARHRKQDEESWAALDAWAEEKRATPKGDPAPLKPAAPLFCLTGNMTEPALYERLRCLENIQGRGLIAVPEIDMLRKLQSNGTKLGGAQDLILNAFDSSMTGALRVSSEAISTYTKMSLNIIASTTFPGCQEFFTKGIERGTVGRVDYVLVPDSCEVPKYLDFTTDTQDQIEHYLDLLEAASGEYIVPEIDALIEEIRLSYSQPSSPLSFQSNPEYFKLSHRQLLIVKQKCIILYLCNSGVWLSEWNDWVMQTFYKAMRAKISIFQNEIASWAKRQKSCVTHQKINGPQSELTAMPQTFTLDELIAYKRAHAPASASDKELTAKSKDLIRIWIKRGKIQSTEDGGYAKIK